MKVAICVGHNHKQKGAFSKRLNQSEYDYNNRVAKLVQEKIPNSEIFNRKYLGGYNTEMEDLAKRVNAKDFDLAIELHFNSLNEQSNGCEALYFHKSVKAKKHAESFCETIVMEYGIKNRGIKALSNSNQNGFGFVKKINAPAIVLEPFFGSNIEANNFINVQRYADTIVRWIECIK